MARSRLRKKQIKTRWVIAAIITLGLVGFLGWYLSLKAPTLPTPPLKDLAAAHQKELGVHVTVDRLREGAYRDIVSSQFAFINIDGGVHFKEVQPQWGQYDFAQADRIVEFAEKHNMPVQLHHLVWGDESRLPNWLLEGDFSEAQLQDILQDHITTVVSRYKGRVKEYTVVNEPFTEAQHIYGLNDWFADNISNYPEQMDNYFVWAHQADPSAKLLINDFYNETQNSVSDAMYDYVQAAKARGVPIDGVGMQMHVDASRSFDKAAVIANMNRFGELGAPVYVTEFDVNTNYVDGNHFEKSRLENQVTYDATRACVESPACISFNVFGLTRQNQLIKKLTRSNSRDYMFNGRYQPRPSFFAFRQAWLDSGPTN